MKRLYRKLNGSLNNPLWLSKHASWLYWRVYGFSWSSYIGVLDNPATRASLPATAVGYAIYLNDIAVENFGFSLATKDTQSVLSLSTLDKLYLFYFGALLVALGRVVYLLGRPRVIKKGPSLEEWVAYGMSEFTAADFFRLYSDIEENGHRTPYGKYYTDDWEAFWEDAVWKQSGQSLSSDDQTKRATRERVDYSASKTRHENLLRSLLIDRYAEYSATNKPALLLAIILTIPGYILFILPSVDLALTILWRVIL